MKITCLGLGAWGFTLANLLVSNGHEVLGWSREEKLIKFLKDKGQHPKFPGHKKELALEVTSDLRLALSFGEIFLESVTSQGVREVLQKIVQLEPHFHHPLILTSKGIEKHTGFLVDEVVLDVLGVHYKNKIACLSGPSIAKEVIHQLPTSCVCSAYDPALMEIVKNLFVNPYFRVYPNSDVVGVELGGAMKNIIAIACGIADGLGFGVNTKSAILTRGLHEIRKLSFVKGCMPETLNGLAGLGDLCTTCFSPDSRNYRFGFLVAEGLTPEQAKEKIGMVVEGATTCVSALELGERSGVSLPITQAIYRIVYEGLSPKEAVKSLLTREIKEEHL